MIDRPRSGPVPGEAAAVRAVAEDEWKYDRGRRRCAECKAPAEFSATNGWECATHPTALIIERNPGFIVPE